MCDITSLAGPVESVDGKLMLRIPLTAGGDRLAIVAGRIGDIQDDMLCIEIADWLVEKLVISEGSIVVVDDGDGKLNIRAQQNE